MIKIPLIPDLNVHRFAYRKLPDEISIQHLLPQLLKEMTVEEGDVVVDPTTCFTIEVVNHIFLLSAIVKKIRDLWLEELTKAIRNAKHSRIEELPQTVTFDGTNASVNHSSIVAL
uniref:Uncharacterized protein n=1 Tax=Onchocerca volvulus TaxID=6282 RepID=A0A8R1XR58_ONCVO